MIDIDNQTVAVENFAELKSILETNDNYTRIHLSTDITMTSGIRLNANRTQMTIDGEYPVGSGIIHFLKEAGGDHGSIYLDQASGINLSFQNLTIVGLNHFGMPYVYDYADNVNVAVSYDKVTYTGPQLIWHPRGSIRITDCNIEINTVAGGSTANEVGEIHAVAIGGTTTIKHDSPGSAAFLFYRDGAALRVLAEANVTITSTYDFLYRTGTTQFIMESRARLSLTTRRGFSRSASHPLSAFFVDEGASFRYIRESITGDAITMYVDGPFTVNKGAKVYMETNYANTAALVQFPGTTTAKSLTLNAPKSFALYNRGTGTSAMAFSFLAATQFTITTKQINHWPVAMPLESGGGGFSDNAPGRWRKQDGSEFLVKGTVISRTTPPGTELTETTLTDDDIDPQSPLSMLQLNTARVFSAGDLPLTVNRVVIQQQQVTGTSEPTANILVTYEYEPLGERVESICDESGNYIAITEPVELPFGTTLQVTANTPFLLTTMEVTAVYDEDLHIEAPEIIEFVVRPFSVNPVMLPRRAQDPEVETPYRLVVTDSREVRGPWHIWAMITMPLQTAEQDILNDAVVYAPEEGDMITLKTQGFELIVSDDALEDITIIDWAEDKGVLLRITESMRSGKEYTTRLLWEVRPDAVEEEEIIDG